MRVTREEFVKSGAKHALVYGWFENEEEIWNWIKERGWILVDEAELRRFISEFEQKLVSKAKAGPPSDYTDLWIICRSYVGVLKREILGEASELER